MNRLRQWWKPGLLILRLVIAAQVGVSLLVRTARARAFLTRQLEVSFGRAVDVRGYSASLFPSPQLDADGITVYEDPDFGHEYFLRADRLSAGLRWLGFLRGRFELGTLELERPSLIFSRDQEGRWNLERWLPAATPASRVAGSTSSPVVQATTPAYHLQKIDISDGRVNFKLGDDKTSFAFIQVEGSVEQAAPGRWRMDLKAQPWRSGVPLQLAGTVRVRGDVAGTSTRLQPAKFTVSWERSSLADVFRLIGGTDFGVRGTFAGEAAVESGAVSAPGVRNAAPGDWLLSVQTRASGIHRWDLTEREDNPRVGARLNGRWNPGAGTMQADDLVIETPRSNLRGIASLKSIAGSNFAVRVDSAGIQAADVLAWYRAFRPGVAEGIQANQYFTGGANLTGWPLIVDEVAFSSAGGRWTVPGFAAPFEVRAVRGGTQKRKLVIEPFAVSIPAAVSAAVAKGKESVAASAAANVEISLLHDLNVRTGGIRLFSRSARIEDVVAVANVFGRQLQNGWELKGKVNADLRWEWSPEAPPAWNGRADVTQGKLQVAGLNEPVELENFRAEWHVARRKFTVGQVSAFGAIWTGTVEQSGSVATELGETELPAWTFQLHADHLDAGELDRWMGPRARPSWLQRLLPAGLGGPAAPPPSVLLQRIRAEGELRADELVIEKIKLKQFEAHAKLAALQLGLRNVRAQWCGGEVSGTAQAEFSAKPRYSINASLEKIVIAQTPWLARASDRLAGTASGSVEIHAEGIGRDALIESLAGKGELRLTNVELRGWDLPATMAVGEWRTGNSRWAAGAGTFHVSDGGFDLNSLRLTSPSGEFLLKGSVSFSEDADMTAESHATGRKAVPQNTVRFLQISGPLSGLKVSLEKATATQPGD